METLYGIAASHGIAIGPAFRFQKAGLCFECCAVQDPAAGWACFRAALETASEQLTDVYTKAEAESGAEDAAIFQAHGSAALPAREAGGQAYIGGRTVQRGLGVRGVLPGRCAF